MATYKIDAAHTVVEFAVKHMMFSTVKGSFSKVNGQIEFDPEHPERSSVVAEAEAASVTTRDEGRDGHVRSADFFDVENHPTISFRSTKVQSKGRGEEAKVMGDLTIHGVTKEVAFDAEFLGEGPDPWGGSRVGFNATTTINRKDFGLQWNVPLEKGGFLVGDSVKITLDVEAVKQA
ncbi:MAG TPA: YceI family protein [Chloroflexota bacterium]|nr:YceI family protein [Chloroflexota bacterium]